MLSFDAGKIGRSPEYLVLRIRSAKSGSVQLLLPSQDWSGQYSGKIKLRGDGRWHTYRLRLGKELRKSGNISSRNLRGELFFFYRNFDGDSRLRPAQEFTVQSIALE